MLTRMVRRVIQVHPPEAEEIANAFGDAQLDANAVLVKLRSLYCALDLEWEGNQKTRFMGDSGRAVIRFAGTLLPGLMSWEKKYRVLTTDRMIETMEYY